MTPSLMTSGMRWAQLFNKNNQQMEKRVRSMEHSCKLASAAPGELTWSEETCVKCDDAGMLPESRCALCSTLRYHALCDDGGKLPAIELDGELLVESLVIMHAYPDGGCALVPELPWSPPQLFSP